MWRTRAWLTRPLISFPSLASLSLLTSLDELFTLSSIYASFPFTPCPRAKGADLFQSLVAVVNLFRGKSRMQIDMLMKDFIKHARIEGAVGDGQDVAIGPQGFRNWMNTAQVYDMFLVDRLYKAADVSKDGQVSFH